MGNDETVAASSLSWTGPGGGLAGPWQDAGYNVASNGTCFHGGKSDVDFAGLSGRLGHLAQNGGPTRTVLLLDGNPAIKAVPERTTLTNDGTPVRLCPTTDQRGVRSAPGRACNAGALQ